MQEYSQRASRQPDDRPENQTDDICFHDQRSTPESNDNEFCQEDIEAWNRYSQKVFQCAVSEFPTESPTDGQAEKEEPPRAVNSTIRVK